MTTDPVFIIGYPRSGTTLLLHMLMASGEFPVCSFPESHFYSHCYRRYGSLSRPRNRRRLLGELERRNWFSGTGVTSDDLVNAVGAQYAAYDEYLRCFMDLLSRRQSKSRWLEKTPWHMLYVNEILDAFPTARFLVLVRDPRDVVLSVESYGWMRSPLSGRMRTAIAWKWHMNRLDSQLPETAPHRLTLRFEDLVTHTDRELDSINSYLGLNVDLAKVREAEFGVLGSSNSSFGADSRGISSAPIGRWRQKLPQHLLDRIDFLLHDILEKYGYADEPSNARPLPLSARLWLESLEAAYGAGKRVRSGLFPILRR